jgi:hypothetical protein
MGITREEELLQLGFSRREIEIDCWINANYGRVTAQLCRKLGMSEDEIKRIIYMEKLIRGEASIGSDSDRIRHLKKMYNISGEEAKQIVFRESIANTGHMMTDDELIKKLKTTYGKEVKQTINDLKVSKIYEITQGAVVDGIQEEPYTIWNSRQYKGKEALYKVISATGKSVTVETSRKPKLQYGARKKIDGVLEILGITQDGKAVIKFSTNVCKLCNRFVVVASTKRPQIHIGCVTIIGMSGRKFYVYAKNIGSSHKIKNNTSADRIYSYGVFSQDINERVQQTAMYVYSKVGGVRTEFERANEEYRVIGNIRVVDDSVESEIDI